MKKILAIIAFTLSGCGSGGSSSTPQNDAGLLDVSQLLNGTTSQNPTSYWQCNTTLNGNIESLTFQAFADRTGRSSAVGDFTWEPTQDELELTVGVNLSIVHNIVHNAASDSVTFSEFLGIGQVRHYRCSRVG